MSDNKKRICFVVGPIGKSESETRIHADWFLEEIIQPVIAQHPDFSVVRADQIAPPGMIDAQVIQHLLDSDLVIADLSKENPNAFYEIGIRQMAQKPIIHMQLADEEIPFDVSLYRTLKFSRIRPADLKKARDELKRAVEAVLASGYVVDNPVTRARGQIILEEHATPEQRLLIEQVKSMQSRLDVLEKSSPTTRRKRVTRKRETMVDGLVISLNAGDDLVLDKARASVVKVLADQGFIFDVDVDVIFVPGIDDIDGLDFWESVSKMDGVKSLALK